MFKKVDLKEGVPVQFLGVYALKWKREWGLPEDGFIEIEYTLNNAISDLQGIQLIDNTCEQAGIAKKEIEEIFRKLTGEVE